MKRIVSLGFGFSIAIMLQTMVLPKWLPIGFIPDFPLLAVLIFGFWKPSASGFWLGLLLGSFQGWLHGFGFWAFALSRGFASIFASWMRLQWLWQSPVAAGFCAAVSTIFAETLLALFLVISERNFSPFSLLLPIVAFETPVNAFFAFALSWLRQPKEVLA